jgi:hypothetical protein
MPLKGSDTRSVFVDNMRMTYLPKVAKTNPNRPVEAKPLILSADTVRIKHFLCTVAFTARASHFFKADLKVVAPTPNAFDRTGTWR